MIELTRIRLLERYTSFFAPWNLGLFGDRVALSYPTDSCAAVFPHQADSCILPPTTRTVLRFPLELCGILLAHETTEHEKWLAAKIFTDSKAAPHAAVCFQRVQNFLLFEAYANIHPLL